MAFLTGGVKRVQRSSRRAVRAAAQGGESVGGEGSAGGGAAEAVGKHGDRKRHAQKQDGHRGGRAAAAQGRQGGKWGKRAEVRHNEQVKFHMLYLQMLFC